MRKRRNTKIYPGVQSPRHKWIGISIQERLAQWGHFWTTVCREKQKPKSRFVQYLVQLFQLAECFGFGLIWWYMSDSSRRSTILLWHKGLSVGLLRPTNYCWQTANKYHTGRKYTCFPARNDPEVPTGGSENVPQQQRAAPSKAHRRNDRFKWLKCTVNVI